MSKKEKKERTVLFSEIHLPLFKVGDDIDSCLIKTNDKVDVKASLENYISLLQAAIDHVQKICDFMPVNNNLTLHGDTHYVSLSGEPEVIERLAKFDLVTLDEYANNEEEEEWSSEEHDDSDKNIDSSDDVDDAN